MILIIFILEFIFLAFFQSHFIFGGDSTEFSLITSTWSISHPPGYPFYALLGNIVTHIVPFLTITWRAALLSSIPTIITSFLIYKILMNLTKDKFTSIISSLIYVVLFPIWMYSEVPEVFSLNNLIIVSITYLSLIILQKKNKEISKYFMIMVFLIGLGFTHHHIFIFFLPAWFILIKDKLKIILKTNKIKYLISFLIGISFYLYAPLASFFNPPLDWENARSLDGFIRLVTRSAYGSFKAYTGSSPDIVNQLFDIFSIFIFMLQDFRILGIIIILTGIFLINKINKQFSKFIFISLILQIFFIFYTNFGLSNTFTVATYERYLIAIYLILIFPMGIGIYIIKNKMFKLLNKTIHNNFLKILSFYLIRLLFIGYFLIILSSNLQIIKLIKNINSFDIFGKNIADTLPRNSIVYLSTDLPYFTTTYKLFSQKYRPDIVIFYAHYYNREYMKKRLLAQFPSLKISQSKNKVESIEEFMNNNLPNREIFFEKPINFGEWLPYGLVWKYYPNHASAQKDTDKIIKINYHLWNNVYKIPELNKQQLNVLFLDELRNQYIQHYISFSQFLFTNDHKKEAIEILKNIIAKYRTSDVRTNLILVNIALIDKQCPTAAQYMKNVDIEKIIGINLYSQVVKQYYETCASGSAEFKNIKNKLDKVKNSSDPIDLNKF